MVQRWEPENPFPEGPAGRTTSALWASGYCAQPPAPGWDEG